MPKLRHYDDLGTVRFITFSCYRRHNYLTDTFSQDAILGELSRLRKNLEVRILGYVIMPEHVHLVILPPEKMKLGTVIGQLKGRVAKKIIAHRLEEPTLKGGPPRNTESAVIERPDGKAAIWQRRCYDHNCRTMETVKEKINYCHENPVKRGLVSSPDEWVWSSSRCYSGCSGVELEIDLYEM